MEKLRERYVKFSVSEGRLSVARFPLTYKCWEGLLETRKTFLNKGSLGKIDSPYLEPEVAESWIRSHENGVNPFTESPRRLMRSEEYTKLLKREQRLINIGTAIFKKFEGLMNEFGVSFDLDDANGVNLLTVGTPLMKEWYWDEKILGTCTIALCKRHKKPVLLYSWENYIEELVSADKVASTAPVFDTNGDIVCFLTIRRPLIKEPWEIRFQMLCLHMLESVISMAVLFENQLNLININNCYEHTSKQLKNAENTLSATNTFLNTVVSSIDEGVLIIDHTGKIIGINKEGNRIFKQRWEGIANRNIGEFLVNPSPIMDLLERGEEASLEEALRLDNDEMPYKIKIRPAFDQSNQKNYGAILIINQSKKGYSMVKNKIGTPAIYTFDNLIGESKEFKQAITIGQRFAKSAENILLCGESGTGKELFAQAIHNSYRPWGPFIAVNCAAVPKNLIESELFGYEAGSFTGADRGGKVGKIELANGGTLFLDEIGDMPLEIQAVLLRVLEDKQVMRIGGQCNHKVDFKVIAATNKNLFKLMKEILFREDLYFRLSVLSINLPSLRERGKDKEILSNYFVKKYCAKLGREAMQISPAALKKINDYDWPGNIRQLENAMIYAVQISSGEVIKLEDLPEYILLDNPEQFEEAINPEKRPLSFKESEKLLIENAIVKAKYDVAVAATMLNISKSTVYRKLKEYNIEY